MSTLATTKMSSKGQVVIPETIRKALGMKEGCQFIVMGEEDVVILKSISEPSPDEVYRLVSKARKQAKKAGLSRSDVLNAVKRARKNK